MTYEVFFVKVGEPGPDGGPIRFPFNAAGSPPFTPAFYTKVAEVEARDLEEVFYLTNSINRPWWENTGVRLVPGLPGARSMSVGDVALGADGLAWVVDGCGWQCKTRFSCPECGREYLDVDHCESDDCPGVTGGV